MAVRKDDGLYYCEICGKYFNEKEGYVRAHEKAKHKHGLDSNKNMVDNEGGQEKGKKVDENVCTSCGGRRIRLLNRIVPVERKAIEAGYCKICLDCEEVM